VVERAAAVLTPRRAVGAAGLVAALGLYYFGLVNWLPQPQLRVEFLLVAVVLVPAVFGLVWLALPLREWRGLVAVGAAFGLLAAVWSQADSDVLANFAKLAAATALAWGFLSYFERVSWVAAVAAIIPLVDAFSVWRGPTRHIVTEEPQVFGALSFAFPLPESGSFALGLPDLLFFALFLGAAARWGLRVGWTWLAMVASLGVTTALAIWVDPFGIGGLPALPGLSIAFLVANADLLWRQLRTPAAQEGEA
jgi:hypothetical protein